MKSLPADNQPMKNILHYSLFCLVICALPKLSRAQAYQTEEKRFPATAVVNVKSYGATGEGKTDDTRAIQQAISENVGKDVTLYFPNGTYLMSKPLKWLTTVPANPDTNLSKWRARLSIQGQSQAGTIIRLADSVFTNINFPTAFIATGSNMMNDGIKRTDGSGNNAFNNLFYDLTIHTGSNNPGAIALDFVGTNLAGLRNVTIKSGDEKGIAGLYLKREGGGPCLFKNVTIEGFDYGIDVYSLQYSQTYEFITLKNQKKAAIKNTGNVLSMRKVYSENAVPVIVNSNQQTGKYPGNYGLITLVDANFIKNGGNPSISAIINENGLNGRQGGLYLRNVTTIGYRSAVQNRGKIIEGANVAEFVSDPVLSNSTGSSNFALPIQETPEYHQNNLSKWVSVTDYGASADDPFGDDTKGIQDAINSGAEVIFFPKGKHRYNINTTIVIGGNVRQLIGMRSNIDIGGNAVFGDSSVSKPLFRFAPGKHDTVFFERFNLGNQRKSPFAGGIFIEHASPQTLVLRDINNDVYAKGKYFYQNTPGAGKLFIENVTSITPWNFAYVQDVWARQLNPESHHVPIGTPIITQNSGTLWILGLKTEGPRTVLYSNEGTVELLGGFLYPTRAITNQNLPAFLSNNANLKLTYATNAYSSNTNYTCMIKNAAYGNTTYTISRDRLGNRGAGSIMPLCTVYSQLTIKKKRGVKQ